MNITEKLQENLIKSEAMYQAAEPLRRIIDGKLFAQDMGVCLDKYNAEGGEDNTEYDYYMGDEK